MSNDEPRASERPTEGILAALKGTQTSVRSLSLFGYVASALLTVAGLWMAMAMLLEGTPAGVALMLLCVGLAWLYLLPAARHLGRYASAIDVALRTPEEFAAVEKALLHQKSFWKFAATMVLAAVPAVLAVIGLRQLDQSIGHNRDMRTMTSMRSIAGAVEAYAKEKGDYPSSTGTIDDLAKLLEGTYIKQLPRTDGWGNSFEYELEDCDGTACRSYLILSVGSDGFLSKGDVSHYNRGGLETTTGYGNDIVWHNGRWIYAPVGFH
jgi:type II secretory pathway pseudopilin PulG